MTPPFGLYNLIEFLGEKIPDGKIIDQDNHQGVPYKEFQIASDEEICRGRYPLATKRLDSEGGFIRPDQLYVVYKPIITFMSPKFRVQMILDDCEGSSMTLCIALDLWGKVLGPFWIRCFGGSQVFSAELEAPIRQDPQSDAIVFMWAAFEPTDLPIPSTWDITSLRFSNLNRDVFFRTLSKLISHSFEQSRIHY